MFKGPRKIVRDNKSSSYPVFELTGVNCSNKGLKYLIGYKDDNIIRPLCIILPQASGCIKKFDDGRQNMSVMIKNDSLLVKYIEIWNKVKNTLNIKFQSMPVYDKKYIKAKGNDFTGVVDIVFSDDMVPKEGVHNTFIVCISIDFLMKTEKKKFIHKFIS